MNRSPAIAMAIAVVVIATGCISAPPQGQVNQANAVGSAAPVATATGAPAPGNSSAVESPAPDRSLAPTSKPTTAPTATVALPLTGRIVDADNRYSVTLPDGWSRIDLGDPQFSDLQSTLGDSYGASLYLMATSLGDIADPSNLGDFSNVGILEIASMPSRGESLDQLSKEMLDGVKLVFGKRVTADQVSLPAGDAIDLAFDMHRKKLSLTGHEYYVPDGDQIFLVSVMNMASGSDASNIDKVATAVANSFAVAN